MAMITILNLSNYFVPGLKAEDYPAEYLGQGYREHSNKIQRGFDVEVFQKIDVVNKNRVAKRNDIEKMLITSQEASPQTAETISQNAYQQKYNFQELFNAIAQQRAQREDFATVNTEFRYIKHSNGKKVFFKNGLASRIENEPLFDEFGNPSIQDTLNMIYNEKRLLIGFEARIKDHLGNIKNRYWSATYTPDSVFYANNETNANKHYQHYTIREIDHTGREIITDWHADNYAGKFLTGSSETVEDSLYGNNSFTRSNYTYENGDPDLPTSYHEEGINREGLAYSLDRTNITYNDKDQATGYHEVMVLIQPDGCPVSITTDAQFEYLDIPDMFGRDVEEDTVPDRILSSTVTVTTEHLNGAFDTKTTTTTYEYDDNNELTGAHAESTFFGKESRWYEYTDAQGHNLTRIGSKTGEDTYFYINRETSQIIIVAAEEVISTLKDGAEYSGYSNIQYEILGGTAMVTQENTHTVYSALHKVISRVEDTSIVYSNGLINNVPCVLSSQEHTEINQPLVDPLREFITVRDIYTTYFYDENGHVIDAEGEGTGSGYEYTDKDGWIYPYTSIISVDYEVIWGKVLKTDEIEEKYYH
ncbi:MAG: hypothetical protein DRP74_07210 [Candidatus Omnitrophota bacterium]|nr:MAG: hypothetical protein DRP74_07210 [Candidatus Omnitrophota bacterium]